MKSNHTSSRSHTSESGSHRSERPRPPLRSAALDRVSSDRARSGHGGSSDDSAGSSPRTTSAAWRRSPGSSAGATSPTTVRSPGFVPGTSSPTTDRSPGFVPGTSSPTTDRSPRSSPGATAEQASGSGRELPINDEGRHRLQVGSYNVAGGNERFSQNFEERTSDLAAQQLVNGDVDVLNLQEVAVDNKNAPGQDYNAEILQDVFAQTYGLDRDDIRGYYIDDQGRRRELTDDNQAAALDAQELYYEGGGHSLRISKESFDSQGNPAEFVRPGDHVEGPNGEPDPHSITVYRAQLDNGDEYNAVFGDTGAGDKGYGNAVILGPEAGIRDENGRVRPGSLQVRELGSDPELWKPESERERRTALGVRFTTPDGQTATTFSAHLSTESLSDDKADELRSEGASDSDIERYRDRLPGELRRSQQAELRALDEFAQEFGGDRNVIIGADFNHPDPVSLVPDFSYFERDPVDGIDHTFVSGETNVHSTRFVRESDHSDHDLEIVDLTI